MVPVSVKAVNAREFIADFRRFDADLKHHVVVDALGEIKVAFYKHERKVFKTQGVATASGRWPALSEKYKAWKEKHYPGRSIMVRTGALRDSLTGGPGGIAYATRRGRGWSIRLGTSVTSPSGFDYPHAHQTGEAKGGKVRRTIDPPPSVIRKMILAIQKKVIQYARNRPTVFERTVGLPPPSIDRRE